MGWSIDNSTSAELAAQEALKQALRAEVAADTTIEVIAEAEQVTLENKIIPLTTVDTVALRNSTYPNPLNGSLVTVNQGANGNAETYRFVTGTGWVLVDKYNGTTVSNITAQLADTDKQINGVVSSKTLEKGILSFTFDNSFLNTYAKVFPEFKQRNIKFAVSPVAESFAATQYNGLYYNYENLKEMIEYGVEMIAHGQTGLVLTNPGVPLIQAEYEIRQAKKYWNKLGFKVNGYCGTNSRVYADYRQFLDVYDYSFSDYWTEKPTASAVVTPSTDIYNMGRHSLSNIYLAGGVAAIKAEIDYIESTGTWLNYYNHQIDTGLSDSIPLSALIEVIDYALTKNIEILIPVEAIQRLNTKLVASENIKRIRSEMVDNAVNTQDNLLINPAYSGGTTTPTSWGNRDTTVGGVTKTIVDYVKYKSIKYTLDATNNVGNYVGLSQVTPLKSENKADIVTFSIEVDSNSSEVDLVTNLLSQDASAVRYSYVSKTQQLSVGRKIYEVSILLPKSGYTELVFNFAFYPKSATAMTIEHSKPKMEKSRMRTPWIAPVVVPDAVPVNAGITFKLMTDNNPTPTTTGEKYILLSNSVATTVTNLVTTDYSQEVTLMFTNANTTVVGSGLIRLKDGLSFVSSAGAVLTLIKTNALSSAWYEKSRSGRSV